VKAKANMTVHNGADIAQVINLARYPINDPVKRQEIVRAAREQMAAQSGISLEDFLAPGIAEAMAAEALAALPKAHRRDHMFSAYPDTGEQLPEGHPRRQLHPYNQWVTPGDTLPGNGLIHRLYGSELFLGFITELLGEAALYRLEDPLMGVVTTIMADGDQHGWHFDLNDFVVSILLQKPKVGGAYESAPHIRTGTDENYEGVSRVLANEYPGLVRHRQEEGTLMLFCGRYALHRVTEITGDRERVIALFSYDRSPGVNYSPSERLRAVGREQPLEA
jgi:hypothetical protein